MVAGGGCGGGGEGGAVGRTSAAAVAAAQHGVRTRPGEARAANPNRECAAQHGRAIRGGQAARCRTRGAMPSSPLQQAPSTTLSPLPPRCGPRRSVPAGRGGHRGQLHPHPHQVPGRQPVRPPRLVGTRAPRVRHPPHDGGRPCRRGRGGRQRRCVVPVELLVEKKKGHPRHEQRCGARVHLGRARLDPVARM